MSNITVVVATREEIRKEIVAFVKLARRVRAAGCNIEGFTFAK